MMKSRLLLGLLMAMLMMMSAIAPAAADGIEWSRNELEDLVDGLDAWITASQRPLVQQFLEDVRDRANAVLAHATITDEEGAATKKELVYALQLAADVNETDAGLWASEPFVIYAVPALSPEMRLPDKLPRDGKVSDQIVVISAQGEYEAASFVIAPLADVDELTFTVGDLQGDNGTISADNVDLRVVKTWYQGGTAWQSYFFDNTLDVLTPELLLHDENLIQVDHNLKKNYLRVDYPQGSQYVDISGSPPPAFSSYTEPVEDSPVLLPIALHQGESKQMWVTTKVPEGTPEGVYTGTIAMTADGSPAGQLTLTIRVLPFELPAPKTYYDLDKDFYVMIYSSSGLKTALAGTGGNTQLAETRLLNQFRNLVEHNVLNLPAGGYDPNQPQLFLRQLELMEEAGFDLDPLFGVGHAFPSNEDYWIWSNYLNAKKQYEADPTPENEALMNQWYQNYLQTTVRIKSFIEQAFNAASAAVGHTNLYFDGWDEADWNRLLWQQEVWDYAINEVGAKIFATGNAKHLDLPIKEHYLNWSGEPTREKADAWHAFGDDKIIASYAYPHTGPENPDLMRQRHGMWLYKANYDATYNYIWYLESQSVNPWGEYVDATFRAFNFVYPTQTDVIDTIAWEGFREGIDDIRYATKLKMLAEEALDSGDPARVAAANKALDWLEETDERKVSADWLRSEMIYHILKLLDLAAAE
jgi:hypothetical protein